MSYAVLTSDKAGSSSGGLSVHIERKKLNQETGQMEDFTPASVIHPERTALNKEYILPPGTSRTQAIEQRIKDANVSGKIRADQVRSLQFVISSDHEKMAELERTGKLDEWVSDSLAWFRKEFGEKNVVSAVLHMDEKSPHVHVTVVPIVSGQAKPRVTRADVGEDGQPRQKRRYKRKDGNRLCAKEVNTRANMIRWQTEYAAAVAKYGLRRGIPAHGKTREESTAWNRALGLLGQDEESRKRREKINDIQREHRRDLENLTDRHASEIQDLKEEAAQQRKADQKAHAAEVDALNSKIRAKDIIISGEPARTNVAVNKAVANVKKDLASARNALDSANDQIKQLTLRNENQAKRVKALSESEDAAVKRATAAEKEVKELTGAVGVLQGYVSALMAVLYKVSEVIQDAVAALISRPSNQGKYRFSFTPEQREAVSAGIAETGLEPHAAAEELWNIARPQMTCRDAWIADAKKDLDALADGEVYQRDIVKGVTM